MIMNETIDRYREALEDLRRNSPYGLDVQSVAVSILSDAQEEIELDRIGTANDKINFAKFLLINA